MGNDRSWEGEGFAALRWLFEQLRVELVVLAGNGGVLPGGRVSDPWFPSGVARILLARRIITPEVALQVYACVQTYEEVLATASSSWSGGARLLDMMSVLATRLVGIVTALQQIPQTYLRVELSPIVLYRDRGLSSPHEAHTGVVVAPVTPSGDVGDAVVYPTPRRYNPGEFTTQEWSATVSYDGPAYFGHPETGDPEPAFVGSTPLFVGREFPVRWNIDLRFSGGTGGFDPDGDSPWA